ncbi:unnamed protein product [Eruca vesicaria subsp. sativa]|uniref:Uncharacterized protein n=1 Tax=Eruca vesicaria subsp. sativa TaxID=29727 RepID=A0ABC8KFI6_ERUVS|nr:unnamed protein product [Eruca vesicaria subsp. sativa]
MEIFDSVPLFHSNLTLLPPLEIAHHEQKYELVKKLQELKHICRMTGDGCSSFEESQHWYRCCCCYRSA